MGAHHAGGARPPLSGGAVCGTRSGADELAEGSRQGRAVKLRRDVMVAFADQPFLDLADARALARTGELKGAFESREAAVHETHMGSAHDIA